MKELVADVSAPRLVTALASMVYLTLGVPLHSQSPELKAVATRAAESLTKAGRKTVAVVDFTDLPGNVTELGRYFAEQVSIALAADPKGYAVVDRTHLKALLQEHKLASKGLIDPQTARQLGQIAGVDALITGTITPFGDSVNIALKVLDTSTAKLLGASTVDIPRTKAIEELLARGIGAAPQANFATPTPTPPPPQGAVVMKGFSFEPKECRTRNNKFVCRVVVTNLGAEQRHITINARAHPSSNLVDNRGNEYVVSVAIGQESEEYHGLEHRFMPQVPLNVLFYTDDVSTSATRVTLIIGIQDFGTTPMLRDIPVER